MLAEGQYQGCLIPKVEWITGYSDPFKFDDPDYFKSLILETKANKASDVYVTPMHPVTGLVNGKMKAFTHRPLDEAEVKNILIWAAARETALTDIVSGRSVNSRYEIFDPKLLDARGGKLRHGYRVNASAILSAGGTGVQVILRTIPTDPPPPHEIGLQEDVVRKACPHDGCVYIAGKTGQGKSTTFASIIRFILENDTPIKGNHLTHEEPVEFTFDNILSEHSIIAQSQIPTHFSDFYAANREAMRRKPGFILIGEMRDKETITAGVEASLTGHPVFGTVHAIDVAAVMRRLISRFPENERATAIFDIIETARFILAQRLLPAVDGKLVAAREWLEFTPEIREQLLDLSDMGMVTQKTRELVLLRGHSFEKEADRLLREGRISEETAMTLRRG